MTTLNPSGFDRFAKEFVRAYWETVKSGAFPMPPNEPIEETLDELLAVVSHETIVEPALVRANAVHSIRMTATHGCWWLFGFRLKAGMWSLVSAAAPSANAARPHKLLGAGFKKDFAPFLTRATEIANERASQ